jgi:hypothetical protein
MKAIEGASMNRTRISGRALATAALVGGLVTGLSACGGSPSGSPTATATESAAPAAEPATDPQPEQAAPVTQPVLASPQPDSPMVSCGLAQVSPRVTDGDPLLGRAEAFFHQLSVAQLVPPAIHGVYGVDVDALTPDQRREVLLLLSSLNQCPGISPQLQQSILDVFDQLAPQPVAQPDTGDAGGSDYGSDTSGADPSDDTGEAIRSDNLDSDYGYADGWWDGYGWWFRPCWTNPSSDPDRWGQWGRDRRDGIWWGWTGSAWERFGTHRPVDTGPHPGKPDGAAHHQSWVPGRRGVPVPPGGGGDWPGTANRSSGQNQGTDRDRGTGPGDLGSGPENPGSWHGAPAAGNSVGANPTGANPTGANPTGANPTGANPTGDGAGGDRTHHRTRGTDPADGDTTSSGIGNPGSSNSGIGNSGSGNSGIGNSGSGNTGSSDPNESSRTFQHPDSSSQGWQNHQSDGWQSHHDGANQDGTRHDSTHQDTTSQDSTRGTPQHFGQQHPEEQHPDQPRQPVQPPAPQQPVHPPAPPQPAGPGTPGVHHP